VSNTNGFNGDDIPENLEEWASDTITATLKRYISNQESTPDQEEETSAAVALLVGMEYVKSGLASPEVVDAWLDDMVGTKIERKGDMWILSIQFEQGGERSVAYGE
jgi:hypothetical protein